MKIKEHITVFSNNNKRMYEMLNISKYEKITKTGTQSGLHCSSSTVMPIKSRDLWRLGNIAHKLETRSAYINFL
jgi:hypothetical protein